MKGFLEWCGAVVLGIPGWLASIPAPVWTLAGAVGGWYVSWALERRRERRNSEAEDEVRRRDRYAEVIRTALDVAAAKEIRVPGAPLSIALGPVVERGPRKNEEYKERREEGAMLAFRSAHALALLEPSSEALGTALNDLYRTVVGSSRIYVEVWKFTEVVRAEFGGVVTEVAADSNESPSGASAGSQ